MNSPLDPCLRRAEQWLRTNSAAAPGPPTPDDASEVLDRRSERVEAVELIDRRRNEALDVLRRGCVDRSDQRTLALLGIACGREGDLQLLIEIAGVVDLRQDSNLVAALVRILVDQQRPDGSVGFLAPELRMLHGDDATELAVRTYVTGRYVARVREGLGWSDIVAEQRQDPEAAIKGPDVRTGLPGSPAPRVGGTTCRQP